MNKYKFRKFVSSLFWGGIFSVYKRLNQYMTDRIDGTKFTYNLNTEIGSKLYLEGEFEKKEIALCQKYIKRNSIVLDIGANIGIHSIYFSRIAKEGLVFSFEPSPETFRLLLKNVMNSSNILPINIGVSNFKNIADFYMASDNAYSSLKDTKRKEIKKIVKVICFTLDDFFKGLNLSNIDFVKIDVEGFEQSVLEGMHWIMEEYHPVIFCEIYKGTNSNEDPEKTINYLIDKGYDAFIFDGNNLVNYEKHVDKFYNYFFLSKVRKK